MLGWEAQQEYGNDKITENEWATYYHQRITNNNNTNQQQQN